MAWVGLQLVDNDENQLPFEFLRLHLALLKKNKKKHNPKIIRKTVTSILF